MNKIFAVIMACICFFSCKPGVPKKLIQPDTMEKVLYEIHLTDGYIGTVSNPDTAKLIAAAYYKGIYNKFAIDSAIYDKSLHYYFQHPEVLKPMYERVLKRLEQLRASNEKQLIHDREARKSRLNADPLRFLIVAPAEKMPSEFKLSTNPFVLLPSIR